VREASFQAHETPLPTAQGGWGRENARNLGKNVDGQEDVGLAFLRTVFLPFSPQCFSIENDLYERLRVARGCDCHEEFPARFSGRKRRPPQEMPS